MHPLLKSKGVKPRTGRVKLCKTCGKEVYKQPVHTTFVNSYCSRDCANKGLKTNKPLSCKVCGKEFYVSKSQQALRNRKHCSVACQTQAKRKPTLNNKAMMKKLQTKVNLYVRLRDCGGKEGGANCISCNKWYDFPDGDGGHFIASTSSLITFDERNVNFQCIKCNRFEHGNGVGYYPGMVRKYGQEVTEYLAAQKGKTKKWTEAELLELIEIYKHKLEAYNKH